MSPPSGPSICRPSWLRSSVQAAVSLCRKRRAQAASVDRKSTDAAWVTGVQTCALPIYPGGVGAEIAAGLADRGLTSLLAPLGRVAGYDTVMPLYRLEEHYMPTEERILHEVRRILAFA